MLTAFHLFQITKVKHAATKYDSFGIHMSWTLKLHVVYSKLTKIFKTTGMVHERTLICSGDYIEQQLKNIQQFYRNC